MAKKLYYYQTTLLINADDYIKHQQLIFSWLRQTNFKIKRNYFIGNMFSIKIIINHNNILPVDYITVPIHEIITIKQF